MNIPDTVVNIGGNAFTGCTNLKSVVIGKNVTDIGHGAFQDCTSLTEVYYKGTAVEWESIEIGDINDILVNAVRYYYSEAEPTTEGNFWHYVNGVPTAWTVNAGEHEHIYSAIEVVVPTCEAGGYTVYACTCGDSYTVNHDAVGHVNGEMQYVKNEAGICECEWDNPWWIDCEVCGTKLFEGSYGAVGHSYTVWEPIIPEGDAICEWRETVFSNCDNCDCHVKFIVIGEARGHVAKEFDPSLTVVNGDKVTLTYICDDCNMGVTTVISLAQCKREVSPTCTQDGYVTYEYHYELNGVHKAIVVLPTAIIPAYGHSPEVVPGYAGSCDSNGLTDGLKCSYCGEVLVEQLVIPAVDHNHGAGVDGASKFEVIQLNGIIYDTYWCEVCQSWVAYRVHQD